MLDKFDKRKKPTMKQDKELEQDIHKLQDKIGDALDYYLELRQKYGELGGWEMVEDKLTVAMGWAETPIEPVSEDDEEGPSETTAMSREAN